MLPQPLSLSLPLPPSAFQPSLSVSGLLQVLFPSAPLLLLLPPPLVCEVVDVGTDGVREASWPGGVWKSGTGTLELDVRNADGYCCWCKVKGERRCIDLVPLIS